jgi:superoxide dismutase, Fe-Mn family
MKHELPPLPYPMEALEPHMSRETLEFHHGKHHRAYVTKLNELIQGTEFADSPLETIVKKASGPIFNNGAQAWNHEFFWNCLAPRAGGTPKGELARAVDAAFGSFDALKKKFNEAGVGRFGSGWVWLCADGEGKLSVASTANADNPMREGKTPVLTCDVWEHAYYIDYRNARPDFLNAFWNLVNWPFVESAWQKCKAGAHA